MIGSRDRERLLQLRERLMRLAFVAAQYGEDLDGFDELVPAGGVGPRRTAGGARRRRIVMASGTADLTG